MNKTKLAIAGFNFFQLFSSPSVYSNNQIKTARKCGIDEQGVISLNVASCQVTQLSILQPFTEYLQEYGLSPAAINRYTRLISILLPDLGMRPSDYKSAHIQRVIYDIAQRLNPGFAKTFTTALRSYLRFLAFKGLAPPDLDKTVPTIAQWRLSSMPRYITNDDITRVIDCCDTDTNKGLRDRAIILLLARLGLRACEIINLYIKDVDWSEGAITVNGKGHTINRLPLSQEVGNVILAYLNTARPAVPLKGLFLCLNAPYRAIATSGCISNLVRAALLRAGITNSPSYGAHYLRHSCAIHTLKATHDIRKVSLWLGHADLKSTEIYLRSACPSEKLEMLIETALPSLRRGKFKAPDKLLEMLKSKE
jgi:site-specific recombinase XerD